MSGSDRLTAKNLAQADTEVAVRGAFRAGKCTQGTGEVGDEGAAGLVSPMDSLLQQVWIMLLGSRRSSTQARVISSTECLVSVDPNCAVGRVVTDQAAPHSWFERAEIAHWRVVRITDTRVAGRRAYVVDRARELAAGDRGGKVGGAVASFFTWYGH
jgi:hypothetical protein